MQAASFCQAGRSHPMNARRLSRSVGADTTGSVVLATESALVSETAALLRV